MLNRTDRCPNQAEDRGNKLNESRPFDTMHYVGSTKLNMEGWPVVFTGLR